jgi:hypothetical protein
MSSDDSFSLGFFANILYAFLISSVLKVDDGNRKELQQHNAVSSDLNHSSYQEVAAAALWTD